MADRTGLEVRLQSLRLAGAATKWPQRCPQRAQLGTGATRAFDNGAAEAGRRSQNGSSCGSFFDGARGTRTPDLLGAIQALSQLSYSPLHRPVGGVRREV